MLHKINSLNLIFLATCLESQSALAAERMATHQDSNAALLIFACIGLIAFGLAEAKLRRHRAGVISAGCVLAMGALSLLWAYHNGQFEQFKSPVTPLDIVKVPLLLVESAIAGIASIFLLRVGIKKSQTMTGEREITTRNGPETYGRVSRVLHWSIALIFIGLIPMGIFMSGLPEGAALRDPLFIVHKSLGLSLFFLVIGRILWHLTNKPPALSTNLKRSNRVAAKTAHILLYGLMIGFPVTGYFMSSYAGKVVPLFFFDLPIWLTPSKEKAMPFGLLHKFALPILFYLTFFAHIAGVLMHHFYDGDKQAIKRISG
jgi:cytochrome b561